jgi:hypothetical protein
MMKKKPTNKAKPAGKPRPVEQAPTAPPPVTPQVAVTAVTTTTSQPAATAPAPKPALMRTRLRTPAQRSAAELIRFLKIHAKRAYGKRGQRAILDLAQRVRQQAQQESKTLAEVIPMHNRSFVEAALAQLQQANEGTVQQ